MNVEEIPVTFECDGEVLVGVVHRPSEIRTRGLLCIIAGGPQYRIGCCRQQILMARELANNGTPVMRFDYRGFGDATGEDPGTDKTPDITAALAAFKAQVPDVEEFVLYGGCDGASAIAIAGWSQPEVTGWIMNNPAVKSEEIKAKVRLKHYYRRRLGSRDFWKKLLTLNFDVVGSVKSMLDTRKKSKGTSPATKSEGVRNDIADFTKPFNEVMLDGWTRFNGDVLLITSGRSLVAKEFNECVAASKDWQKVVNRNSLTKTFLEKADHTFSEPESREMLSASIRKFMR